MALRLPAVGQLRRSGARLRQAGGRRHRLRAKENQIRRDELLPGRRLAAVLGGCDQHGDRSVGVLRGRGQGCMDRSAGAQDQADSKGEWVQHRAGDACLGCTLTCVHTMCQQTTTGGAMLCEGNKAMPNFACCKSNNKLWSGARAVMQAVNAAIHPPSCPPLPPSQAGSPSLASNSMTSAATTVRQDSKKAKSPPAVPRPTTPKPSSSPKSTGSLKTSEIGKFRDRHAGTH